MAFSICDCSSSTRASIDSASPFPSTIVVCSLVTVAFLASPNHSQENLSSFIPFCLSNTLPPVVIAMSSKTNLRLSPKSGAFTAHTLIVPLILFTIKVANASLSISSAIINNDLP